MIWNFVASFAYIFLAELFLTLCIIYTGRGIKHRASSFAALNTALYFLNIENIIASKWCILFCMAGAYCGTLLSFRLTKE